MVARRGSPLIVGVGNGEYIIASDAAAIVEHTTQVVYLNDNEMAVVTPDGFKTMTIDDVPVTPEIKEAEFKLEQMELGKYEHFMMKEIIRAAAGPGKLHGRADRSARGAGDSGRAVKLCT